MNNVASAIFQKKLLVLCRCFLVLFFFTIRLFGDPVELTNAVGAIHLVPPAGFYAHMGVDQNTDSGDSPFNLDGPEFLSYVKYGENSGEIAFEPGMVGAYIGAGKVLHFKRVTASLLKAEMEEACMNISGGTSSVTVETIDGYTAANLIVSGLGGVNPRFFISVGFKSKRMRL